LPSSVTSAALSHPDRASSLACFVSAAGISGTPATQHKWEKTIRDDPVKHANTRGTLSFAMSGPNTRTTQLFLNFGDSSKVLDGDFAPFAEVVEGMEAVDAIFKIGEGELWSGSVQCAMPPRARAAGGARRAWQIRCDVSPHHLSRSISNLAGPPSGKGPAQGMIKQRGNEYLDAEFPQLTRIVSARVTDGPGAKSEL
jgi:hypothetical protein